MHLEAAEQLQSAARALNKATAKSHGESRTLLQEHICSIWIETSRLEAENAEIRRMLSSNDVGFDCGLSYNSEVPQEALKCTKAPPSSLKGDPPLNNRVVIVEESDAMNVSLSGISLYGALSVDTVLDPNLVSEGPKPGMGENEEMQRAVSPSSDLDGPVVPRPSTQQGRVTFSQSSSLRSSLAEDSKAQIAPTATGKSIASTATFQSQISKVEVTHAASINAVGKSQQVEDFAKQTAALNDHRLETDAHSMTPEQLKELNKSCFRHWATLIVKSQKFEFLSAVCTVANLGLVGLVFELNARNKSAVEEPVLSVVQQVFCIFFLGEYVIRFVAAGITDFVTGGERGWNFVDTVVVTFAVLEFIMECAQLDLLGQGGLSRLLRIIRLLRVIRIVRILRFSDSLRLLVGEIGGTLMSLCWAIVLLALIIYSFCLVFTQAATQKRIQDDDSTFTTESGDKSVENILDLYFSGVGVSMGTLFMSIAGGLSWDLVIKGLHVVSPVWSLLYIIYISFTYFAVLNVMTANFVQNASNSASIDQDLILRGVMDKRRAYAELLRRLFRSIDTRGIGEITLKNLELNFKDESVQAFFRSLDLEPDDAWGLFKLLDSDGGRGIDMDEFVEGCMRLRGHASAIDMATIMTEHRWLSANFTKLANTVEVQTRALTELTSSRASGTSNQSGHRHHHHHHHKSEDTSPSEDTSAVAERPQRLAWSNPEFANSRDISV